MNREGEVRARRSAGYLIMSNAGASLSLRVLDDATSLPIAWTSTAPRIKNGLRRPPQPSRLRSPAARQLLSFSLVYVSVDTRKIRCRETGRKFQKQNCENREMGEGGRKKRRGSNGDGKQRRVQIEDLSVAFSPLCPRAWLSNHPSATAPPFPKLPRRGAWQFGD